jgi:hypothetical protein
MHVFADTMSQKPLQDRVTNIVKPLIPPDAEERVTRAFKQWNQIIREHIRNETALKLTDGDARQAIQVRIVRGFPTSLATLIDRYNDPVLWWLIIGQPKLGGIIEGLEFLLRDWSSIEHWPLAPPIAKEGWESLQRALAIASALQQAAMTEKVRKEIQGINHDILGAYHFPDRQVTWIALYWMPIAMFAAMLHVRIEDLTLVVLAHELTHGYTHMGRDIDGNQWNNPAFARSDLRITEGLAQFYTQVVVERITSRLPGPQRAFERLLKLQSDPYQVHTKWLQDHRYQRGEAVRFALVAARNRSAITYDAWLSMLVDTAANLSR